MGWAFVRFAAGGGVLVHPYESSQVFFLSFFAFFFLFFFCFRFFFFLVLLGGGRDMYNVVVLQTQNLGRDHLGRLIAVTSGLTIHSHRGGTHSIRIWATPPPPPPPLFTRPQRWVAPPVT